MKREATRYDFENVPDSIVQILDNMSCGKLTSMGIILNEPQKADDFDKAAIKLLAMWELEGDSQSVRDKTSELSRLSNSRIGIEAERDALKHEKDIHRLLKL